MARGYLAGAIWGTVFSGLAVGGLSVANSPPSLAPGMATSSAPTDTAPVAVAEPEAPQTSAPEPMPSVTESAPRPDPAPAVAVNQGGADAPARVPAAPEPAPAPSVAGSVSAPNADTSGSVAGTETAARPVAVIPESSLTVPEAEGAGPRPSVAVQSQPPVQPQVGGAAPAAPAVDSSASVETTPAARPEPEPQPEPEPEAEQEAAAVETDTSRPAIGTPAVPLTERNDAHSSTRLPTVAATDSAAAAVNAGIVVPQRPLKAYSIPFEAEEGKPLMSIILIDDGRLPSGASLLASFGNPLTIAVDTAWPGAPQAMQDYRAAGFEVLAMVSMPERSDATDVEVAMQSNFALLPEVVGVLEAPDGSIAQSREVTDQMAAVLRSSGHGLVFYPPTGLNTAQSMAEKVGATAATAFRDFDGQGQEPASIRRFLDQAAFRAGQEGSVIVIGRLRADTISALLLWGLQDRATRVALAPVSAILMEPR